MKNPVIYRLSQLVSLLLGARIFMLLLLVFALYVSTYFLFNQEESLRQFVFDFKIHGIIFCSVLTIAAGGIINRFYDREKDSVEKPFRYKLQSFLKEKYFLYTYLILNAVSLTAATLLSPRILVFFLVYQFLIWLYSHKLSRIAVINNLVFVALSLYPFFGAQVYYRHFSPSLFWMAIFLFLLLLAIDIIKDLLTKNVDRVFNYQTLPNLLGRKYTYFTVLGILLSNIVVSAVIVVYTPSGNYLWAYFLLSALFFAVILFPIMTFKKSKLFWVINFLRLWVFIGVVFMLLNGIYS